MINANSDEDQPEYHFTDHIHRLCGDQDQAKSQKYIKYGRDDLTLQNVIDFFTHFYTSSVIPTV